MRIGSLFSGYGGLDLAVEQVTGATPAWFVEYEAAPSRILAHHWPDVPNLGDVTTVDWSQVEPVDVITGGSPCQDLSHAGKRAGMTEGTRSNLWVAMREAIAVLRPSLVVWENVRGAYSAPADSEMEQCSRCVGGPRHGKPVLRALGRVLGDLSDLGYVGGWHGLRAADVGAPHSRFRVFVVATRRDAERFLYGGNHGWRGLHSDRASEARHVLSTDRAYDVLQGVGHDAGSPSHLWRQFDQAEAGRPYGDSSGMLVLADYEREVHRLLAAHGSPFSSEEGACPLGDQVSRDSETDAAGTRAWGAMVGVAEGTWRGGVCANEGAQPYWATTTLLPTPTGSDTNGAGLDLRTDVALLPTPRATDGTKGGPNQAGSSGDLMLPSAVQPSRWGQYTPAIARWEHVLGRPAPDPTEPTGRDGAHRLSARFVEWMMGLPDGWVTGVPGVTRNHALKALGNGCVPQQVALALQLLGGISEDLRAVREAV